MIYHITGEDITRNMTRTILALVFFFLPLMASAQVVVSEIMYDLSGSDTDREWIEIQNIGAGTVDIAGWKLFEALTNHGIATTSSGQTFEIPGGIYAVIVDDKDKFLLDWPAFAGALFDSSFSLSNTGEILTLRDIALSDVDSVTYDSSLGGVGDGNSLVRSGATFNAALPTPGSGPPPAGGGGSGTSTPPEPPPSTNGSGSTFPVEPQIFASAGKNRTVIVSADSVFEGDAWGLKNEPLENARYIWNFGNGEVKEGKRVLAHYDYPGEYVVILSVASGRYSASARIVVFALSADVSISRAEPALIELTNKTNRELDLSYWYLATADARFMLPKDTVILPSKSAEQKTYFFGRSDTSHAKRFCERDTSVPQRRSGYCGYDTNATGERGYKNSSTSRDSYNENNSPDRNAG